MSLLNNDFTHYLSPGSPPGSSPGSLQATTLITGEEHGRRVYDPIHPDADEDGFVTYPNISLAVGWKTILGGFDDQVRD